ncbi:hypothetical protein SAMN05444171_1173 [Bradyrhizobium lablabi]|uniref:Uncharacterized protein n=2 Tax=Bradyrhizobium TaxID=374 RepID=A0A1H4RNQ5_9BRAD|nr:hypothetical protein SAMN05444163_5986 [Bradyrhizobium ottawaense]SEC33545.1 hypothetical protein SAMN05444171_1173 [Bradyrhizobium lablabi]
MHVAQETPANLARFSVICESCGSLTIKAADLTQIGSNPIVRCGRCDAVRGTLAQLHSLARTGTVEFTV